MRAADYSFFDAPFLALAHRGGAQYGPNLHRENTRHAFDQAYALGYRWFETDVHATADGVLLAFHDDRLDRVTAGHGLIGDLPYAAVQDELIGGQDPIPTLDELLDAFPDVRFNIDAKAPPAVPLLARAIANHEAYDRVCVSSFGIRRLHHLRRLLGPRVASAASSLGVGWNRFAPAATRLLGSPAPALQMPLTFTLPTPGGRGRVIDALTPALLRTAHAAGKQVHIWTVDDATVMHDLIDRGIDGIFTDRIDTLKDVLVERGLWV
ncbi:MAG: glycerophosphodiester phosphodiesterase family protein [Propionibacteriaceae bacterium]